MRQRDRRIDGPVNGAGILWESYRSNLHVTDLPLSQRDFQKERPGNGTIYSHTVKDFLLARTPLSHGYFPPSVVVSRWRARARRDMTVPIGTSVV